MKRLFTFSLAIMVYMMCFANCFAVNGSAASLETEDTVVQVAAVPIEKDPLENVIWSQSRSPQVNFAGLGPNSSKLGANCWVTQGITVLKVNYCTWDAGKEIYIGFFNLGEGKNYGVAYTNGYIDGPITITTENVPTGNYAVWVQNASDTVIFSGILDYEVIG